MCNNVDVLLHTNTVFNINYKLLKDNGLDNSHSNSNLPHLIQKMVTGSNDNNSKN